MYEFDPEELEAFKVEAMELLDEGEEKLLSIEQGADFLENYNAIFRVFHSLKGAAGMLGKEKLQSHMHKLENYFMEAKERETLTLAEVNYFLNGIDAGRHLLAGQDIDFEYTVQHADIFGKDSPKSEKEDLAKKRDTIGLAYCVDDEEEIREVIKEILEESEFQCEAFADPEKIIEAIKRKTPDVIISDFKMPGMDGNELLNSIHKIDPDIPVVLVSGHVSKDILIESIKQGVFSVIEKPFNQNHLISTTILAAKKYQLTKLLNKSFNFIMFQFSDLKTFLESNGKAEEAALMEEDLKELYNQRRKIRSLEKIALDT